MPGVRVFSMGADIALAPLGSMGATPEGATLTAESEAHYTDRRSAWIAARDAQTTRLLIRVRSPSASSSAIASTTCSRLPFSRTISSTVHGLSSFNSEDRTPWVFVLMVPPLVGGPGRTALARSQAV